MMLAVSLCVELCDLSVPGSLISRSFIHESSLLLQGAPKASSVVYLLVEG